MLDAEVSARVNQADERHVERRRASDPTSGETGRLNATTRAPVYLLLDRHLSRAGPQGLTHSCFHFLLIDFPQRF